MGFQDKSLSTMNMKLEDLFTEYDADIEANAFRDPMGLQIIWSAVGQNIFGRNITVVSSDIRIFTLNLFHHYIVRELTAGSTRLELSPRQKQFYTEKSLKTGLIIFLENLCTYMLHLGGDEVTGGIPGMSKAQGRIDDPENTGITISINVDDEILVRQISLGINGRYRTPFIHAGLVDGEYRYEPHADAEAWSEVRTFFSENEYSVLARLLLKLVEEMLFGTEVKSHPTISIEDGRLAAIQQAYVQCFGKHRPLNVGQFVGFWRRRLRLDAGAAGALYNSVKSIIDKDDISIENVIHTTLEAGEPDEDERVKIEDIKRLEPFLISIYCFFQVICAQEIEDVQQVEDALEGSLNLFPDFLENIRRQAEDAKPVLQRIDGFSKARLQQLTEIDFSSVESGITGVQKYQSAVMEQRGNSTWFSIVDGRIKHNVREYSLKDIKRRAWDNSYYISSLISICRGLEGSN